MRWFKHFSDNHRGRSINTLMDRLGHQGLAIYILMEMCTEKLERKMDLELTEVDCIFRFHPAVVRNNLRMKSTSARRVLEISQELGWLKFSEVDNEIIIEMPMLLDLLDYDLRKTRSRRVAITPGTRLEKSRVEIEKSRVENLPAGSKERPPRGPNVKSWEVFSSEYFKRYKVNPTRNAKVNSAIANFVKRVGEEDAPEILKFFIWHNDGMYLKTMHDIGLALRDAEALRTQWLKGRAITMRDIQNFEKANHYQEQLDRIERGEA